MTEILITAAEAGKRLDVILAQSASIASRAQAARLIESGAVRLNGEVITAKNRVLTESDRLEFEPIAEPDKATTENSPRAENIPLDIRFEDDYLIVLSKPAGLVCHPATGHQDGTLVNALVAHCGIEHLAHLQGDDRPGIVHRLDRDTSGLMLVAKTDEAGRALQDAIRLRSLDRRYLTLVDGYVAADNGLIDAPLARSFKDRTRYAVSDEPGARGAVTSFQVLERFAAGSRDDGYSLLECKLFSGRTHQIRVHMAYTQHPVIGDQLYGFNRKNRDDLQLLRQFLHSYALDFIHPITEAELSFRDRLPQDLLEAMARIQGESMGRTARGEELRQYFDPNL